MPRKISDYFCVGTSGPTIDGRELDPQWFIDSGKSYDIKLYQAFVWLEHYRYYGNFGEIFSMKFEKQENGSIKMYNRIIPSDRMIELNNAGQKLHSSVEIVRNFARTEKAYQIGLGVTDSPASLSTDRLKFNTEPETEEQKALFKELCNGVECQRTDDIKSRIPGFKAEELEIFTTEQLPDLEFKTEKKFFDVGSWFSRKENSTTQSTNQQEVIDMDEKEFKSAMADIMQPFSDKLDKFQDELDSIKSGMQTEKETPAPKSDFSSKDNEEIKSLKDEFAEMKTSVTELMNKLDNEPNGSNRPNADGSNGGGNEGGDNYKIDETW